MIKNRTNELLVEQYRQYLKELNYSEKTYKSYALNKLRTFTRDKDFSKINIEDLKELFAYLKNSKKFSDPYLSSLGTELRRFFRYLKKKGVNDNLMYSLVIPARKRERKNIQPIPIDILKNVHRKFHPRG